MTGQLPVVHADDHAVQSGAGARLIGHRGCTGELEYLRRCEALPEGLYVGQGGVVLGKLLHHGRHPEELLAVPCLVVHGAGELADACLQFVGVIALGDIDHGRDSELAGDQQPITTEHLSFEVLIVEFQTKLNGSGICRDEQRRHRPRWQAKRRFGECAFDIRSENFEQGIEVRIFQRPSCLLPIERCQRRFDGLHVGADHWILPARRILGLRLALS
ncbi:hypothetical protein D3C85_1162050 [compost metagenome]